MLLYQLKNLYIYIIHKLKQIYLTIKKITNQILNKTSKTKVINLMKSLNKTQLNYSS